MMSPNLSPRDPLAQVKELNRLFLTSLKDRDADELRDSGFPAAALPALRSATSAELDGVAEFPRALFDLRLGEATAMPAAPLYTARQILELTIVHFAWTVSRDSAYHARLFFGLSSATVHRLRTTPLSELPRAALTSARVDCAFGDSEWLWRGLLTETRPEARRHLALVALQPSVAATDAFDRVAERPRGPGSSA